MANLIDKEVLYKLYVLDKKPIRFIARSLKHGEATILNYLIKYEIPRRPQHQMGWHHSQATKDKLSFANSGNKFSQTVKDKMSLDRKGKIHDTPKRRINQKYVQLWEPKNPMRNKGGYVYEHRKVMSEIIGRSLTKNEMVHHINGIKDDNSPQNLELTERKWHKMKHKAEIDCPKCKFHFHLFFVENID